MRMLQLSVYFASVTDLEVQSFQNKKSLRDLAEMRLLFFSLIHPIPPTHHTCSSERSVYQLGDGASLQCQWNCGQSLITFSFFLVGCQIDATVKAISRLDSIATDSPAFAGSTGN